jgi:hypothetical protein
MTNDPFVIQAAGTGSIHGSRFQFERLVVCQTGRLDALRGSPAGITAS